MCKAIVRGGLGIIQAVLLLLLYVVKVLLVLNKRCLHHKLV